jgi:hypothetical protein
MVREIISPHSFSLVERVINKGPIPNAQSNLAACILNMIFYSCILPIAGIIYIRLNGINILNFPIGVRTLPIEILILWIAVFLFSYTCLVYHASGRLRKFLTGIGPCLTYDKDQLAAFEENTTKRVFKPPPILLIPLLATIPFGVNGVISNPIYTGNIVTTVLIGLMLLYSTLLHWVASWMLYTFLTTSSRFGRDVPLRINPFDPDKVGGLAPLSNLSTLAIFDVGLISLIVIPIWEIFYPPASFVMIGITSILVPAYFLFSMRGIYDRLREEKEASLNELNDEIQQVSKRIRNFIKTDHERKRFDEKEAIVLGQTMSSMDIIYGHVQSMHTFPVNAEIIAKVFVSAILPILAVVLDFGLSRFL